MSITNLAFESELIRKMVYEFGTMSVKQVYQMFPKSTKETVDWYIMALYKKQIINFSEEKYLIPSTRKTIDREIIKSLWILLDKANPEELSCSFRGDEPIQVCYFKENTVYEIMSLSKHTLNLINFIAAKNESNKISKDKSDDGICYIFVINDESLLERIAEYDIKYPHIIAYFAETDDLINPQITYYKA